MNLRRLREETRAQHEATEALLPHFGPDLDIPQYVSTLQCFYLFVKGWEDWADRHVPARLGVLLRERKRAPLLLRDLQFFGASPLPEGTSAPSGLGTLLPVGGNDPLAHDAAFLGSMYVLEGSTLGGQYIAQQVEPALGLEPGEGDAYFRGHGAQTSAMWQTFRELLAKIPEEYTDGVIYAAGETFAYVQETIRSFKAATPATGTPYGGSTAP